MEKEISFNLLDVPFGRSASRDSMQVKLPGDSQSLSAIRPFVFWGISIKGSVSAFAVADNEVLVRSRYISTNNPLRFTL